MVYVYVGLGVLAGICFLCALISKDKINTKIWALFGAVFVSFGILLQWAEQIQASA